MFTETLKERQALAFKTVTTLNNTATYTPGLPAGKLRRFKGIFVLGTLTSSASVNISLQWSADDVTYANLTNLTTNPTVTAITTDDSLNCLEVRADQLPATAKYVRAYAIETASQNAVVAMVLIGEEASYKPGNQFSYAAPTNDVVAAT